MYTGWQLARLGAAVSALPAFPGPADAIDHAERLQQLDTIYGFSRGRTGGTSDPPEHESSFSLLWVHYDRMLKLTNQHADNVAAAMREPLLADRLAKLKTASEKLHRETEGVTEIEARVILLFDSSLNSSVLVHESAVMSRELALISMANACYFHQHGKFVDDLSKLDEPWLPASRLDRFTAAPWKYRFDAHSCIIYSVGRDGVDDGGVRPGKMTSHSDLVAELRF